MLTQIPLEVKVAGVAEVVATRFRMAYVGESCTVAKTGCNKKHLMWIPVYDMHIIAFLCL